MKPQNFNDLLALLYFPFVLVWILVLVIVAKLISLNAVETFGLGVGTGIILAGLKDILQFYFRKAKTEL